MSKIITSLQNQAYRDGWDRIFNRKGRRRTIKCHPLIDRSKPSLIMKAFIAERESRVKTTSNCLFRAVKLGKITLQGLGEGLLKAAKEGRQLEKNLEIMERSKR